MEELSKIDLLLSINTKSGIIPKINFADIKILVSLTYPSFSEKKNLKIL